MLRQVAEWLGAPSGECFFWAAHSGPELDLLWVRGRRRWGFEFKRTSAPALSPSLLAALDTLQLQKIFLVHAGDRSFPLHRKVEAVAADRIIEDIPQP